MNSKFINIPVVFLTIVRSPREKRCAHLLVDSIRAFGGELCNNPIWLFEANPQNASCQDLANDNVRVITLNAPTSLGNYLFADKVFACAQAEAMSTPNTQLLIWMDASCLVVNPLLLFDLGNEFDVALRPVHIRNVGALTTEPLDEYWQTIYRTNGVDDIAQTVESFVDEQWVRAYFNTHAFAVKPNLGLLARWHEIFASLVGNATFQSHACADELHQIFLHQAILSTLVATMVDASRVRILPPTYNYPLHLHTQIPIARRAQKLNSLVCPVYEDEMPYPSQLKELGVDEPLGTWLYGHI
jgi:hypothetical protein